MLNRFWSRYLILILGFLIIGAASVSAASEGADSDASQPAHGECRLMLGRELARPVLGKTYESHLVVTQVKATPLENPPDNLLYLKARLERAGATADVVDLHREVGFIGMGQNDEEQRTYATQAWAKFTYHRQDLSKGFRVTGFSRGTLSVEAHHDVVRVTSLPLRFPREMHEDFARLRRKGFQFVTGPAIRSPWYAMAKTRILRELDPNASPGVIFIRSSLLTATDLAHEMKHALDSVADTEAFLDTLPILKPTENEAAILGITRAWLDVRSADRALRQLFDLRSSWRVFVSGAVLKELLSLWKEIFRYSTANTRLLYHMLWVQPFDRQNLVYTARILGSAYVCGKSVVLLTNGLSYFLAHF